MMKYKNKEISLCKVLRKLIPMIYKACPVYFIMFNVVSILHGISYVASTFMTQKFFDSVSLGATGEGSLSNIIVVALGLGLALIISQVLNGIFNFIPDDLGYRAERYIGYKINEKAGKLDPLVYEDASKLDEINKAKNGFINSIFMVITVSIIFTYYIPYFIMMGIYLYDLDSKLALTIILIFTPVALTQFLRVKVFAKLEDDVAPIRREYEYYKKCITHKEYYRETRGLGAFKYFEELYVNTLKVMNHKIWTTEKSLALKELLMKSITLVGYMCILYLLVKSLINGNISVGAFGAVFASVGKMFSSMEEIICRHMGRVTQSLGTVKNLVTFLELPEREGKELEIEERPSISLNNVCFSYPNTENLALKNINLEVKSGETIAIVGENGAGKTTLVKLMMGLYVPTDGSVLIGGEDTSQISPKSIYKNISAVFQKYEKYKMTLGENVAISSLENDAEKSDKFREEDIKEALSKAELEINEEKFTQGFQTMLSREFDGIDLSGGQWQRVAIARGLYKNHNMIVLDEPTAAIDPVMETQVYKKFAEISKGKTAIIVTHRLGSAKIADRIVVMDKGNIDDIGTHEELMKRKGKYKEMYESQSKWYVR